MEKKYGTVALKWFTSIAEILNDITTNRVPLLLQGGFAIQNVSKNYILWGKWAKAALDISYHGIYIEYLSRCKPIYDRSLGNAKIVFAHSIPSPAGVDTTFFDQLTQNSMPYGLPIQSQRHKIKDKKIEYNQLCNNNNNVCKCNAQNKLDFTLLQRYINNAMVNSPNLDDEVMLLKYVGTATGAPDMYILSNNKLKATKNPEYSQIDEIFGCDQKKEWFLVHGHLPFGIPYSSEVTYNMKVFKRICVDVSNDGKYSGISNGSDTDDNIARKNWAYVTFSNNTDDSLSITAVGRNQGNMYYISDMRKLQFEEGKNYEATGFNPYMGLEKDTLNVQNCEMLITEFVKYSQHDEVTREETEIVAELSEKIKKCISRPIISISKKEENLISKYHHKYHHKFYPNTSEESNGENKPVISENRRAIVKPPMFIPIPQQEKSSGGKRKQTRKNKK